MRTHTCPPDHKHGLTSTCYVVHLCGCRACMDGPPPPGSRMALREGTAYPSICVTCGAPADDSTLVERGASRRSIPLALLGAVAYTAVALLAAASCSHFFAHLHTT